MFVGCVLWSGAAAAAIGRPVEDRTELLELPAREALAARLVAIKAATGVAVAVVIEDPVGQARLEDASWAALRTWSPEAAERGVVLYVWPATQRWRLEVGWGVEAALPPAKADALLRLGQAQLNADKLDAAAQVVIDGVGATLAGPRYVAASMPPLVPPAPPAAEPGADMAAAPAQPETHHAEEAWGEVGGGPLKIGAGPRSELPGEAWVEELPGSKRIYDRARVLSPSWEAAMVRKLTPLARDHQIIVTLVSVEPGERRGESMARHAERLMRRWLQLAPGGARVLVLVEAEPAPRVELRTSIELARLYTPLRVEALLVEAMGRTGEGGHLARALDHVVDQLGVMALKREALESSDGATPKELREAPALQPQDVPTPEVSMLRVVLVMLVSAALVALLALCVWVAWTVWRRR
jgi:uncharacterized membrane protein YgcG